LYAGTVNIDLISVKEIHIPRGDREDGYSA
jgi:hypothetical protein